MCRQGYATGYALRVVGKGVALFVGCTFMAVQVWAMICTNLSLGSDVPFPAGRCIFGIYRRELAQGYEGFSLGAAAIFDFLIA